MDALLEGYRFIFTLPLLSGLLLALVLAFGGGAHDGGGHGGSSHGGSGHSGSGHESAGHGTGYHSSGIDPTESAQGFFDFSSLPHLFGLGLGVPLSVLLPILLTTWGMVGLMLSSLLSPALHWPLLYLPVAVLGATFLSAVVASTVVHTLEPIVGFTPNLRRGELVGRSGRVVFTVTLEQGVIHARDRSGHLHRLSARLYRDEAPLPPELEVLIIDFDPLEGVYRVERHPLKPWLHPFVGG